MRIILCILAVSLSLPGCVVTGGFAYTDPATGATANLGISHGFDGKTLKPIRGLSK